MLDPDNPEEQAYAFLRWRWPEPVDGWLTLCYRQDPGAPLKVKGAYPTTTAGLRKLAREAIELSNEQHADTWVLLNGLGGEPPPGRKGPELGLRWLVGLHEDLDKGVSDPVAFLTGLGEWRPNIIVDSGNGVHAYWLYDRDVDLLELSGGQLEQLHRVRGEFKLLANRFHRWLELEAGAEFDDCSNLDRIMRLPGTWNRKRNIEKRVQVVQADDGRRFNPLQLEDLVRGIEVRSKHYLNEEQAGEAFGLQGTLADGESAALIERLLPVYVHRANTGADGGRNNTLFKLAQQLNDHYVPRELATDALLQARRQVTEYTQAGEHDPLTTEEVMTSLHSAYRLPPRGPAGVPQEEALAASELAAKLLRSALEPAAPLAAVESVIEVNSADVTLLPAPAGDSGGGSGDGGAGSHHTARVGGKPPSAAHGAHDRANGIALAAFAKNRLRLLPSGRGIGDTWLIWDGRRWVVDAKYGRDKIIEELSDALLRAATQAADLEEREQLVKRSQRLLMNAGREATYAAARDLLAISASELDPDPYVLNCRNGLLDLRTGELRSPVPEDWVTKLLDVDYVPGARDAVWEKVLGDLLDAEQAMWLQKFFGYCLTGDVAEKAICCLYGPPDSGKSTISEPFRLLLGSVHEGGYSTTWDADVLQLRANVNRNEKVAALGGARLVVTSELEEGAYMATSFVKSVTGGEAVDARALYQTSTTVKPRFKLLMHTNHIPRTPDRALQKRLRFVYLDRQLPLEQRDPSVKLHLEADEGAKRALLAWAVRGLQRLDGYGGTEQLGVPPRQEEELAEFRRQSDHIVEFIEDAVEATEDGTAVLVGGASRAELAALWPTKLAMRAVYEQWCSVNGYTPIKPQRFKAALEQNGGKYVKVPEVSARVWRGWKLTWKLDMATLSSLAATESSSE